ncbi:hypothetical protein J6590_049986 [Homalodisca vitripennis]|nr:hypothetical protein J6590_049986 [Homalodisca vitripennis]
MGLIHAPDNACRELFGTLFDKIFMDLLLRIIASKTCITRYEDMEGRLFFWWLLQSPIKGGDANRDYKFLNDSQRNKSYFSKKMITELWDA